MQRHDQHIPEIRRWSCACFSEWVMRLLAHHNCGDRAKSLFLCGEARKRGFFYGSGFDREQLVVGAGAVVTKNIPDNVVAVGVPAKPIETIDEYVKKNMDKFVYIKNLSYEEKKKILLE